MFLIPCARTITGVYIAFLVAACSTPQTNALPNARQHRFPDRVELEHVVFYPQKAHQCGPASLAAARRQGRVAYMLRPQMEDAWLSTNGSPPHLFGE